MGFNLISRLGLNDCSDPCGQAYPCPIIVDCRTDPSCGPIAGRSLEVSGSPYTSGPQDGIYDFACSWIDNEGNCRSDFVGPPDDFGQLSLIRVWNGVAFYGTTAGTVFGASCRVYLSTGSSGSASSLEAFWCGGEVLVMRSLSGGITFNVRAV